MRRLFLRLVARLLMAAALLWIAPAPSRAHAQLPNLRNFQIISRGEVAGAAIGVAAVIGVAAYFLARAPRTTGCVMPYGGALGLQVSGPEAPLYLLAGDTAGLHPGERVKVVGRKHRQAKQRVLQVSRVAKEYGPCTALAGISPPATATP